MNAAERRSRDDDILRLFMGGASLQAIGKATGLGVTRVDQIVKRELAAGASRRALLSDEALAIHQERQERLFEAHWAPALAGDHRSALVCQRILASQARIFGLDADGSGALPAPTAPVPPMPGSADEEATLDDLATLRAKRTGA